MKKNKISSIKDILFEFSINHSQSFQQFKRMGDTFLNIGLIDIAEICFSSALQIAQREHNEQQQNILNRKLHNLKSTRNNITSPKEKRVVAKSFFSPIYVKKQTKREIKRPALIRQVPPEHATLASRVQWVKSLFSAIVTNNNTHQTKNRYIQVLRQFGSYTPLLDPTHKYASGGGYFVSYKGYGIVIDPGHNFIQNFLCTNHSIKDIDAIIVTHAHDDHMGDLIGLNSLIYKKHESNRRKGPVKLYLNEGAFQFFKYSSIGKSRHMKTIGVLSAKRDEGCSKFQLNKYIDIESLPANHIDIAGKSGVGLAIHTNAPHKEKAVLIYSSDTGWSKELQKIYEQYNGCSLLLLHLGSIHSNEVYILDPKSKPR